MLRVLGPLVVVLTIAVLATGIVLLFLRPGHRSPWLELHQGVFCAWFVVMTAHVLGHLAETARVAPRDWRLGGPSVVGAGIRRALVGGSVVAGLVLGIWGQSRVADWCGGRVRLPAGQVVVRTWC